MSNLAQPTNLTNLSQGLAYNQYFFGAVDNIAVDGIAKPTTTNAAATNQTFLRTRLLIPPVLSEQGSSYSASSTIPQTLPGAGCVTVFGNGVGPASQPGFTPAAGGHLVAATAQEANVELGSGTPCRRPARPTGCPAPAGASCWPWGGSSSRPCSWPGAHARRAGARGDGPDRRPGRRSGDAGEGDTHGGRTERHDHDRHVRADADRGQGTGSRSSAPTAPGPRRAPPRAARRPGGPRVVPAGRTGPPRAAAPSRWRASWRSWACWAP